MLKTRVIPTLLMKNHGLVKGVMFDSSRRVGPVLPTVKIYNRRDVDELIIVDILGQEKNGILDYESFFEFSQECSVPLTIGGGISSHDQVQKLLSVGADKITINSSLYTNPQLILEIVKKYGSQCLVGSIDVRKTDDSDWQCFSFNGTKKTGKNVLEWAKFIEGQGVGEIILTSIDRDGSMKGYDIKLIETIVSKISIPIIASGGAGNYQHMVDAVLQGGASAVAAASMFHFTEKTPFEAKKFMHDSGIPVRLSL